MGYGEVSVRKHGTGWRVWLDDVDVSSLCVVANDRDGWVDCIQKTAAGSTRLLPDRSDVLIRRDYGRVRIEKRQ